MKHNPRKPLNPEHYTLKLIKDLGILEIPGAKRPKRMAIFECPNCGNQEQRQAQNAKQAKMCHTCTQEQTNIKKMKPLLQEDYQMRIIKDLGTLPTPSGTKKARYAIFECTDCKKHFTVRAMSAASKSQLTCRDCSDRNDRMYSHKLYPVWNGIKQRCYSPARKDYHRYGGLGVTMAPEWKDDPVAFITWCEENGWEPGLAIDKDIKCKALGISPAIYAPNTVTFVTPSVNSRAANGIPVNQLSLDGEFIATFNSAIEAAEALGHKSGDSITRTCRGTQQTSAGFKWAYADTK